MFRLLQPEIISDLPSDLLIILLGTIQRLLFAKPGFEEVQNSKGGIASVFALFRHSDEDVQLAAASVAKAMVVQMCEMNSTRYEIANRKAVFQESNIKLLTDLLFIDVTTGEPIHSGVGYYNKLL